MRNAPNRSPVAITTKGRARGEHMPVTTPRVPAAAPALERLHALTENIRHCEDLSELLGFVADMAGGHEGPIALSDPGVCARVWRGVAGVHEQIRASLALAHTAAEQLHETTVDLAKHGGR
jgi:hypothetical protein